MVCCAEILFLCLPSLSRSQTLLLGFAKGLGTRLLPICVCVCVSLVPRLSQNANMYRVESLVPFLHKHDVIKIGPKQKGNVLHIVQPTTLQRLVARYV